MVDQCVPPENSEDNSLHWVLNPYGGNAVWAWNARDNLWTIPGQPRGVSTYGWRYLYPASPDDAAALAEARAEIERLTRASGVVDRALETSRAQVAALTTSNAALRAALVRVIEMQSEHLYGHSETAAVARTALAQSRAGEASDVA